MSATTLRAAATPKAYCAVFAATTLTAVFTDSVCLLMDSMSFNKYYGEKTSLFFFRSVPSVSYHHIILKYTSHDLKNATLNFPADYTTPFLSNIVGYALYMLLNELLTAKTSF